MGKTIQGAPTTSLSALRPDYGRERAQVVAERQRQLFLSRLRISSTDGELTDLLYSEQSPVWNFGSYLSMDILDRDALANPSLEQRRDFLVKLFSSLPLAVEEGAIQIKVARRRLEQWGFPAALDFADKPNIDAVEQQFTQAFTGGAIIDRAPLIELADKIDQFLKPAGEGSSAFAEAKELAEIGLFRRPGRMAFLSRYLRVCDTKGLALLRDVIESGENMGAIAKLGYREDRERILAVAKTWVTEEG